MKQKVIRLGILKILTIFFYCCNLESERIEKIDIMESNEGFTQEDILGCLDNHGKVNLYEFFPNLGHGYLHLAGTKMTLFRDNSRWAIVFETIGYDNRQESIANISFYFGNCLTHMFKDYDGKKTWSNMYDHWRASPEYLKSIYDDYELLSLTVDSIKIGNQNLKIERDPIKYQSKGIVSRKHHNPNNQIDIVALTRYLVEENYELFVLTESEIKEHLPKDLPKLMEIKDWYHKDYIYYKPINSYEGQKPSSYDTFQMIADVLVSGDVKKYNPKITSNTHWSNWPSSGGM